MKKIYCVVLVNIKNLENLKYHTFSKKHYFFQISAVNVTVKLKRYLRKKKNQ